MNINLHIERLILDGLPVERSHGPHLQLAVEAELTRLLAENGLSENLRTGGAVPSVRANAIPYAEGNEPAEIGTQVARSIYSGIGNDI